MKEYNNIKAKDINAAIKAKDMREMALMLWVDTYKRNNSQAPILKDKEREKLKEAVIAEGGDKFYTDFEQTMFTIEDYYAAIVGYYWAEADTLAGLVMVWRGAMQTIDSIKQQFTQHRIKLPQDGLSIPVMYNDSPAAWIKIDSKEITLQLETQEGEKYGADGVMYLTGLQMAYGANLAGYILNQRNRMYDYMSNCKGVIAALEEYLEEHGLGEFLWDSLAKRIEELKTNGHIRNRYEFPESYYHKLTKEERKELAAADGARINFWRRNEEPTPEGVFFDYDEISANMRYYDYIKSLLPTLEPWEK